MLELPLRQQKLPDSDEGNADIDPAEQQHERTNLSTLDYRDSERPDVRSVVLGIVGGATGTHRQVILYG